MIALTLFATAQAAETIDVRIEGQSMGIQASDLGVTPGNERIQAPGLSVTYELGPKLGVVGNWHHRRARVSLGEAVLRDRYDEAQIGVRWYPIERRVFAPTVTVQGSTLWSRVALDEAPNVDGDPSELSANAWAFGGVAMAGVELAPFPKEWRVQATLHYELGYQYLTELDNDPLGSRQMGGFVIRGGTGVRF